MWQNLLKPPKNKQLKWNKVKWEQISGKIGKVQISFLSMTLMNNCESKAVKVFQMMLRGSKFFIQVLGLHLLFCFCLCNATPSYWHVVLVFLNGGLQLHSKEICVLIGCDKAIKENSKCHVKHYCDISLQTAPMINTW